MIETAATPTASTLGNAPGLGSSAGSPAPATGGNPADPGAFANMLPPDAAAVPADGAPTAGPLAARQALAALPALTTVAGKILPVPQLPVTETPDPPGATPAGPPVPVLPLLRAVRPLDVAEPVRPRASGQASDEATSSTDEPTAAPPVAVPALVFAQAPAQPDPAGPVGSVSPGAPSAQSASAAPLLPPAIAAQLMGQTLPRPVGQAPADAPAAAIGTSTGDDTRTLRVAAVPAAATAQAQFTLASPAAPTAHATLRLRPVVETSGAAPSDPGIASALPAPLAEPASILPNAATASTAPAGLPGLGHSFAAVVDRLMAARDAVQADGAAQPVAVNLRHAEFGTVSVRFEQRADGLSVALASPDPDFARAVQAATPASGGNDAGFSGNPAGSGHAGGWTAGSSGTGAQGQPGQRGPAVGQSGPSAAPARPDDGSTAVETAPRGIYA